MTAVLAVATFLDAIIEHRVVISFQTLYLSQVCFALVIIAVSLSLRGEALRVEKELQHYRSHMDDLVEARVRELDEAHARLADEERERRAAQDALRRRVEELSTLQRMAQILAGRSTLEEALGEATDAVSRLFEARYARVWLDAGGEQATAPAGRWVAGEAAGSGPATAALDAEAADVAIRSGAPVAEELGAWPGLSEKVRALAAGAGAGSVLAAPLVALSGPAGALVVVRDTAAAPFTAEERQLAGTIADALAAVTEIDRLHREETRHAAAEERQALARDLHDAVTQSIYSATLIAEALPAVYERDPEEGLRNLERLRRLVRAALAEMRTLLFELRPAALETAPLDGLLERLGDVLAGQADVEVEVEAEDIDLPGDVKIVLYRVTQEAFSNVAKYARATRASARIALERDGRVTLRVADDGRGFDPAAVPSDHMGLRIMRERLEGIGAECYIESSPGGGTTITAVWREPASDRARLETLEA